MTKSAQILTPTLNGDLPRVTPPGEIPGPGEPFLVRLDTGRVIEMVIGELEMFYDQGDIPDDLTPIALRSLVYVEDEEKDPLAERAKRNAEWFKLAKWLATQVVKRGGPVERFHRQEIGQIWRLANSPALAFANFRAQQARHVEAAFGVRDVSPDAEPTSANNG